MVVLQVDILGLKDHSPQRHRGLILSEPLEVFAAIRITRSAAHAALLSACAAGTTAPGGVGYGGYGSAGVASPPPPPSSSSSSSTAGASGMSNAGSGYSGGGGSSVSAVGGSVGGSCGHALLGQGLGPDGLTSKKHFLDTVLTAATRVEPTQVCLHHCRLLFTIFFCELAYCAFVLSLLLAF